MHFIKTLALPLLAAATVSSALVVRGDDQDLDVVGDTTTTTEDEEGSGLEKRSCYVGGATWGNQVGVALAKVDDACRSKFTGPYVARETKSKCYDIGGGKRVNFSLKRNAGSGGDLDYDTCRKYLRYEIVGCSTGGVSNHGNWRYRSDPNSGGC